MLLSDTLLLADTLRQNAVKYPQKTALIFEDSNLTYASLNQRVNSLAHALLSLGLQKGERVALLSPNRLECIEVYLANAKLGTITVPINCDINPEEIGYIINHSSPKALILDHALREKLEPLKAQLSSVKHYISWGKVEEPYHSYERLLKNCSPEEPLTKVKETDPYLILYTGSTTGYPKGVLISQRAHTLSCLYGAIELGITYLDRALYPGPHYQANVILFFLMHLYLGGSVCLMRKFEPAEVLKTIQGKKVTTCLMLPTMFNLLMDLPEQEWRAYRLDSLRIIISSGSPLHTKTKEWILRSFPKAGLYEVYAAIELGMCTVLRPEDQKRKVRSIGKPFLGYEVQLLNEHRKPVSGKEGGEAFVRGPGLLTEYYKDPEATQAASQGEWFSVGDIMSRDEEGYYYIIDRKHDLVITGGINIYPIEVDKILLQHPKVKEAAVIGVPDEKWGEALKALVVLKPGEEASEEEILTYCQEKLADFKKPKSVEFLSALPKYPSNKLLKRALREKYWQNLKRKVS
jgi:acyl-CoA synthetase (AMP-forming)/AMP-acid ligase II